MSTMKNESVSRYASMSVMTSAGEQLTAHHRPRLPDPLPHPKWRLLRVISGHTGWVRCLSVDPSNTWFASGSADRTIKIWDLPSGTLKLTLTGHISTVRALSVSDRHPYLFSGGEDKKVLCWDLEQNKVVRHFHGHLHGVYTLGIHPRLDVLVTGSRDATARVWDMRSKQTIHVLSGHRNTITSLVTADCDPQIITGSMDSSIRLWDLAAGKTRVELTHHKKGVRALAMPPTEFTFVSGGADAVKRYGLPDGIFLHNYTPSLPTLTDSLASSDSIVNTLAINEDNVVFAGSDDGVMRWWDHGSGHCFQTETATVQPGSLDCEAGILSSMFDRSGLRLITAEVDKTIKIWGEEEVGEEEGFKF